MMLKYFICKALSEKKMENFRKNKYLTIQKLVFFKLYLKLSSSCTYSLSACIAVFNVYRKGRTLSGNSQERNSL